MLRRCKLISTLLELGASTNYEYESQRTMRQGYMGAVIKLSNIIQKHKDKDEVKAQIEEEAGAKW